MQNTHHEIELKLFSQLRSVLFLLYESSSGFGLFEQVRIGTVGWAGFAAALAT